ncbi:MAG TPA: alpha/beta fold hydrolase [Candidatus Sulfopaludibacter sp.]|nr:alpha/beta fold hydrolase [Candidatus Sulfopaludibacter sp.]
MRVSRLWRVAVLVLAMAGATAFWERPVRFFDEYTALRMRLAGAESRRVTIEGIQVHYYALGPAEGQAVVLVHGLGGRADDWENLAPFLARAGYRVYLPDLPGYGRSERPVRFSYSVRDEAAVVAGFFDALGLKRADLGGWSMGGWIAQLVAAEHPERVRKLMLFDSAGLAAKPDWDTGLFTPATPGQLDALDALLMPNPPQVPGFVARDLIRLSKRDAWVIHRALDSMLTGRDATDALLPQLKLPVLMVWGSLDRITPLSQGETMHRLVPQSELDVIPGCGHLAPRQCAAQIAPTVVEFAK